MSVASAAPAKVIHDGGEISTNLEIRGRRYYLVAGKDGLTRQIKGPVADPRIDAEVAAFLRGVRGWRVGSWPEGYEPHEEIIRVPEGTVPPPEAQPAEEVVREAMLSQMRFIGRPRRGRQETPAGTPVAAAAAAPATDDATRLEHLEQVSELMAEITALTGTVAAQEARIAELEAESGALRAKLDQQGRIVTPATPPRDGSDGVNRAAPTAEDLGKGPNLDPKTSKRNRGKQATGGEADAPPVAAATAGIQRA
jgi:hypothetical protein